MKKKLKEGYWVSDVGLGVERWVYGELIELGGIKCGVTKDKDNDWVVTELSTGGIIHYEQDREIAISRSLERINSIDWIPALDRAKEKLAGLKIKYPVNNRLAL